MIFRGILFGPLICLSVSSVTLAFNQFFQMRVLVSREFLESVEKNVICQRPAWRVDAAKADTDRDSVLLLTDHSLFPGGNLFSLILLFGAISLGYT